MGAGDSLIAGFLHGYLEGLDLPACMTAGAQCSAVTLSYEAPGKVKRAKSAPAAKPWGRFFCLFYRPVMTVMTSSSSGFRVFFMARPSSISTSTICSPRAQMMRLVLPSASSCTAS